MCGGVGQGNIADEGQPTWLEMKEQGSGHRQGMSDTLCALHDG